MRRKLRCLALSAIAIFSVVARMAYVSLGQP